MPINQYTQIVFNEGEPLDANKLNRLQDGVNSANQTSAVLYNSTLNSQSQPVIPIINAGQVVLKDGLPKNTLVSVDLALGDMFAGLGTPKVVATYRSGLSSSQYVSVAVVGLAGSSPKIHVVSSVAEKGPVYIDWIACFMKTVTTA
jgi:hypothetical protein